MSERYTHGLAAGFYEEKIEEAAISELRGRLDAFMRDKKIASHLNDEESQWLTRCNTIELLQIIHDVLAPTLVRHIQDADSGARIVLETGESLVTPHPAWHLLEQHIDALRDLDNGKSPHPSLRRSKHGPTASLTRRQQI